MGNIYYIKYLLVVFCFALFLRFFFFFNLGFALKIRIIYSMFTNCVYTLKIVVDTITDGLPFSPPFPPLPTSTQPLASLPWPSLCVYGYVYMFFDYSFHLLSSSPSLLPSLYTFEGEKEKWLFIVFEDGSLFFTSSEMDYFIENL